MNWYRGGRALSRQRRRRNGGGFTLFELMVVVVLVAILAVLATPALRQSRDDRAAFNDARTIAAILHRARTRAAGRGAAHLVAIDGGAASRGRILLFEALDGTASPSGPNPVSSCKTPGQWTSISAFAPGTYGNVARIVDGLDMNTAGVRTDADITAELRVFNAVKVAGVMCVTPGGQTYVGAGNDLAGALADMEPRIPFTDVIEVRVARHKASAVVGLTRRVLTTGTSAPRIKSE